MSDNVVNVTVDLDVQLEDFKGWEPAQIRAFLKGLAELRTAVHDATDVEDLRREWRQCQEDQRHLESCLEAIATHVGLKVDDFGGVLWAAQLTTAILKRVPPIGPRSESP